MLLFALPVRPPINIVYDQYRSLESAGKIERAIRTVVPYSANDYVSLDRLQEPSQRHWMGTEQSGADVFSRMLHATRIALSIGFIATGISVCIGVFIGGPVYGYPAYPPPPPPPPVYYHPYPAYPVYPYPAPVYVYPYRYRPYWRGGYEYRGYRGYRRDEGREREGHGHWRR